MSATISDGMAPKLLCKRTELLKALFKIRQVRESSTFPPVASTVPTPLVTPSSVLDSHSDQKYVAGGNKQCFTSNPTQLPYCEICKIKCSGPQAYLAHLNGEKHRKKEAGLTGLSAVSPTETAFQCKICRVTVQSSKAFTLHTLGKKHQKVVKLLTKLGKPIPPSEPELIHSKTAGETAGTTETTPATSVAIVTATPASPPLATTTVVGSPEINFSDVSAAAREMAQAVVAQWREEKVIQPGNQDYVEELRGSDGETTGCYCLICDCHLPLIGKITAKFLRAVHVNGQRHRNAYDKKVRPCTRNVSVNLPPPPQVTLNPKN